MIDNINFKAMLVEEVADEIVFNQKNISLDNLSSGDVIVKVAYSSINFKDMLGIQKNGGVIRTYPMIPGIDFAGVVVHSKTDKFKEGQEVLLTGYDVGMSHTGGFSEYARVPNRWLVPLPDGLTMREAMIIGTAGLTAGLSVQELEDAGMSAKKSQTVLVTGASGGVGSVALSILKCEGYDNVIALTKDSKQDALAISLGANKIIKPEDVFIKENPTLLKGLYNYVLDTVGGDTAASLMAQIIYDGAISMCGNAGGVKLSTTVLPFILRGIKAIGIDSVQISMEKRQRVWANFATKWHIMDKLEVHEVGMDGLKDVMNRIKTGQHIGRTIVKIS